MRLHGDDHVVWYQSSQEVKRGFYGRCGSTLFWQPLKEDYEWIGVSAALFDSPLLSKIAKHTFVSEQGSYYDIADKASQHLRY
jgi:hypothetical protein